MVTGIFVVRVPGTVLYSTGRTVPGTVGPVHFAAVQRVNSFKARRPTLGPVGPADYAQCPHPRPTVQVYSGLLVAVTIHTQVELPPCQIMGPNVFLGGIMLALILREKKEQ
jgi:hypothetical protein